MFIVERDYPYALFFKIYFLRVFRKKIPKKFFRFPLIDKIVIAGKNDHVDIL